ncbi:hypothetical protein [Acinetobacter sp. YH12098]|uniref:hypothetical protein n=1 Tax=Acinetobacter sp. YH12098 TaxID=2601087 RepID=UPI0015D1770D|nr:hypothetical protein [Acinetobacter sp. YH12098]
MGLWDELSSLGKALQNVTADVAKKSEEYAASPIHAQQYKKQVKESFEKVVEHVKGDKDISEINIHKVEELLPKKIEYQEHINELIKNKNLGLFKKYSSYMKVEINILNILFNLVAEKYGDKTIDDSHLDILNCIKIKIKIKIKIENETNLLSQELKKFESFPSIDQLKILAERIENLFSSANELFFSTKKILLENYPEISIL